MNKLITCCLRLLMAVMCLTAIAARPRFSYLVRRSAANSFSPLCSSSSIQLPQSDYEACFMRTADECRRACAVKGCFLWLHDGRTSIDPFSLASRENHVCSCIPMAGCRYGVVGSSRGGV